MTGRPSCRWPKWSKWLMVRITHALFSSLRQSSVHVSTNWTLARVDCSSVGPTSRIIIILIKETPSLNFQCPFKFFLLLLLFFFWNSRTHFEDMIVFDGPHLPRERWWQPEFLSFFQVTVILLCPSLSSFRTFWPLKTCTLALTVLHVARILSGSEWCAWTQNHLP